MRLVPTLPSNWLVTKSFFALAWLCSYFMEMTASAALMNVLATTGKAVTERSFLCSDGVRLAAQHWTSTPNAKRRILCLHGWLDNCRSFHKLAPSLLDRLPGTELVALDFPGHGLSSHKSADSPPIVLSDAAFYVAEAVKELAWDSFDLVGHSMGAAVSIIYAASFPEQVTRLVLLEGAGPLTRNAHHAAKHVRASIEQRQKGNPLLFPHFSSSSLAAKGPRVYPTIDLAVETRCKTASLSPGNQYLSKEASLEMVQRATTSLDGGGVQFRHDPRLQWPSVQYMTDEQVEGLYHDIQCPTCLLLAHDGWPLDATRKQLVQSQLQPAVLKTLKGSHHFHADPDTADDVAEHVVTFLEEQSHN